MHLQDQLIQLKKIENDVFVICDMMNVRVYVYYVMDLTDALLILAIWGQIDTPRTEHVETNTRGYL
jgi:hypothetical protein